MHPAERGVVGRWWYALKPQSIPKLLVPAALGQALGVAATGRVSMAALWIGLLFTLADLSFIVFLNDWADRDVDALKRRMFPQAGSPKTIYDNVLPAHALLLAGLVAGVLALLLLVFASYFLRRSGLIPLGFACLATFAAYSLPPLSLNYRGGGELLEMLGVGVLLPGLHSLLQCGSFVPERGWLLVGFSALALASAIASGLSDEQSDRRGGKTTFVTWLGNRAARLACEASLAGGLVAWLLVGLLSSSVPLSAVGLAVIPGLWQLGRLRAVSAQATTNAFGAQGRYKRHLHRAIWWSAATLSAALVVNALWL